MTDGAGEGGDTEGDAGDHGDSEGGDGADDRVRVWLVERTYSDDEQNIVILIYATPDGERYLRKERALTSFTGPARDTTAAIDAEPGNLGPVGDPETIERYRTEVERMAERYESDEAV